MGIKVIKDNANNNAAVNTIRNAKIISDLYSIDSLAKNRIVNIDVILNITSIENIAIIKVRKGIIVYLFIVLYIFVICVLDG